MPKYLIEVPHGGDKLSCHQKANILHSYGSHFVTHADWGCSDGDHKAWMIVEIESKKAALQILPIYYRNDAKITEIMKFTRSDFQKSDPEYHA